jgi:Flp pilus assembly protein TadG
MTMVSPVRDLEMGKRRGAREGRDERGQSLVETALILPILLLLIVLVVDAARALDGMIVLTNAVREGARYGSLEPNPPEDAIKEMVVEDVLGSGTNITNMKNFTDTHVTIDVNTGVAVTVTATYPFPLWFGGLVGLPQVTLEQSAVFRHAEQVPEN